MLLQKKDYRKRGLMSHQNWWQLQHSQLMAGGNKILANSIDVDAVLSFESVGNSLGGPDERCGRREQSVPRSVVVQV